MAFRRDVEWTLEASLRFCIEELERQKNATESTIDLLKQRLAAVTGQASEPTLVHVGRDGQPHYGPREACTICFMWDQIVFNEQNGDGK